MGDLWNKVVQFFKDWGNNQLVVALIGAVLFGVLGFFLRQIWGGLKRFSSWLWAKLHGRGADHAFEKTYLNWLISRNRYLGILPAQVVTRRWGERQQFVSLEDVYVSLSVNASGGAEIGDEGAGTGHGSWRKQPGMFSRFIRVVFLLLLRLFLRNLRVSFDAPSYQPGDLGLAIDTHKWLVIRGDPGSGKSTLLSYLAVTCARSLRRHQAEGDSAKLVKKRLLWDTHPFPLLVTLRRHGSVASWSEERDFSAVFLEEMEPDLRRRCPKGFFERRLDEGNCLILLDGFDELGSLEARTAMAYRIEGFLQLYPRLDNHMVVTTRIVGYEGQLDRFGFTVRTVQDLNAGQVRALVKQRYKATIEAEVTGRMPLEARELRQVLMRRPDRLIERIESTPRLQQLATNPLLLSLIVLVHYLNIELPKERVLLYRDCVEILTERWRQIKREEAGIGNNKPDELTLTQKVALLEEIAFTLQQQRQEEGSQALIPHNQVRDLIAAKLPEYLNAQGALAGSASQEMYRRKAEEWMEGIKTESGILVEKGFDQTGEPLVGFSHLTFQEYLAASAINKNATYRPLLWQHVLTPSWREVVLLYAALTDNATPILKELLAHAQEDGLILAGYCLTEPLKGLQTDVQRAVLDQLKERFAQAESASIPALGRVMSTLGGNEIIAFVRQQLRSDVSARRIAAARVLGQARPDNPEIEEVRADLVQIVETPQEVELTVAARESLAQIGDPRFAGPEPQMIGIPPPPTSFTAWPRPVPAKKLRARLVEVDYWHFHHIVIPRRVLKAFEIGKYPVTNIEYSRFVEATGYQKPKHWQEGIFAPEEATHPVTQIEWEGATAYCEWLSSQTGKRYRLPTEWEWEWAAAGTEGRQYPWGDAFDTAKCNTSESGIGKTTPVGTYLEGISPFGVSDMSGNVWERTDGYLSSSNYPMMALNLVFVIAGLTAFFVFVGADQLPAILRWACLGFALVFLLFSCVFLMVSDGVPRGGAFNSKQYQASCFYRVLLSSSGVPQTSLGFRCVREID
ncbi:MAG TPA: SUMF1/EgtB/PvdO family nonheme iron enzyme [Ktedonobacterales bacterium]|nr:SUMF1/EgtB/PvdO family nonheme iron enzyme [Ktedonobacterales bacterium]